MNGERARILVVDDEEDICGLLKAVAETDGHEVIATTLPEEALDLLETSIVDLVLTDLRYA